ncbi:DUF5990 family protein [Luteolibacter sp. GHJ8]|uniref:DUF5990 family protein n=1 Tax=Luteolibacter rhizosphaerae TaxID=2989719 RepID=A0ABT3G9J4_9BACT|nr:DUF5990 family protein [Luteolibacter rhizosphaerae]MCW1916510.1 DUF5990 family protein [Luteolibacter rhizosphaerae]
MKRDLSEQVVRMRIVVSAPLSGVTFAVQRGKAGLLAPTVSSAESLEFEFSLRVAMDPAQGFNFLGEFAQGPRTDRFIYLNSGTYAGQPHTTWARRAKLKLASIPAALIEGAMTSPGQVLEARLAGTGSDGGPICATVKPEALEWRLVRSAAAVAAPAASAEAAAEAKPAKKKASKKAKASE